MIARKTHILKIESAEYAHGYKLNLRFSDGTEHVVDFGLFLQNSRHPEIRKYLKPQYFKRFRLENGDLMWGDFDLTFPIMDLYENRLDQWNLSS